MMYTEFAIEPPSRWINTKMKTNSEVTVKEVSSHARFLCAMFVTLCKASYASQLGLLVKLQAFRDVGHDHELCLSLFGTVRPYQD